MKLIAMQYNNVQHMLNHVNANGLAQHVVGTVERYHGVCALMVVTEQFEKRLVQMPEYINPRPISEPVPHTVAQ